MGVNATTSVPKYTDGEVLEASRLNVTNSGIPVFADATARDAAFGGTGEKVLAEGQYAYLESTNASQFYDGAAWQTLGGGLTWISTTTIGTAVSTVTVSNAFSATYDNYKIIVSGGTGSVADAGITMTLGATATGYLSTLYYQDWTNGGAVVLGNTSTYMFTGRTGTNGHSAVIEVISPYLSKWTTVACTGSSPTYNTWSAGILNNTTSYTAFTLARSAGTFTGGEIRVYGYQNS